MFFLTLQLWLTYRLSKARFRLNIKQQLSRRYWRSLVLIRLPLLTIAPISNLNNISKILENLCKARAQPYIISSPNFSQLQSAYRPLHSTETALLHTIDNIYRSSDQGRPTIFVSIDHSSAFDMAEHIILLNRLYTSFGISGTAFSWICSYLKRRSQCVRAGQSSSRYR